jgi:filamentous hemagglutinin family protein
VKIIFFRKLSVSIVLLLMTSTIHAEVITDGTFGSAAALPGPNYLISDHLGQQRGSNLFHSFQDFNLQAFESATFSGPSSIQNIINRVTGGNPSQIDGLIRSTIPNADMYFLNPAGIMFGPNARLDIPNSLYISTADYLRLEDIGRFDATNPENSLLTVAPPSAFGFLNTSPGRIEVNYSQLVMPKEKTLALVGGDIDIKGETLQISDSIQSKGFLFSMDGHINLVSAASQGEISINPKTILENAFEKLGKITITDTTEGTDNFYRSIANVDVSGFGGGGEIYIRSGQIVMDNGYVFADSFGGGNGRGITIRATDELVLANHSRITADNFKVNDEFDERGDGNAGNIDVIADHIMLTDGSRIAATTITSGKAGNITLVAVKSIEISGDFSFGSDGFLSSGIYSNTIDIGDGGQINLATPNLMMSDNGVIRADTSNIGDAGDISIQVDTLTLNTGATINSSSIGYQQTSIDETGNGGNITINAGKAISISGYETHLSGLSSSGLFSSTFATGEGGAINILSPMLNLQNHGFIQAGSLGEGNAGNIFIEVDKMNLHNAEIATQSTESAGGDIHLRVRDSLYLFDSIIIASSRGARLQDSGGNISIGNPSIFILDKSQLTTTGYVGDGGNIRIIANNFISSIDSIIDASSSFGRSGEIWTSSLIDDHHGIENFSELPNEFIDVASQLSLDRCAGFTKENLSRFIITARDIPQTSPYELQTHSTLLSPFALNTDDLEDTDEFN